MSDDSVYTVAVWGAKTDKQDYFVTGVKTPAGYAVGINWAPHGLKMDMKAVVTQALRKMTEEEFMQAIDDKVIGGGQLPEVDGPVVEFKRIAVQSVTDEKLDAAYNSLEQAGYEILLPEVADIGEG